MRRRSYAGLLQSDTLTGSYLLQAQPIKEQVRKATSQLPIRNARANNLQDVSVDIPVGVLTAITGHGAITNAAMLMMADLRRESRACCGAGFRSPP